MCTSALLRKIVPPGNNTPVFSKPTRSCPLFTQTFLFSHMLWTSKNHIPIMPAPGGTYLTVWTSPWSIHNLEADNFFSQLQLANDKKIRTV